ncbi:hypothetical protein [Brucella anthropi]|uniref:hypothetical protein n=1 Tax=Brucella anthropi TaxID=529 RepID=UPI0005BAD5A0|nr:hypothetical protein [Brucella anthropi]KIU68423.1 hypothetical protein TR92_11185 [Brucella anthropi]
MSGWKDISEAPTDGSPVDLWRVNIEHGYGDRVADAWFEDNRWMMDTGEFDAPADGSSSDYPSPDWKITHFMKRPIGPNGETDYGRFG